MRNILGLIQRFYVFLLFLVLQGFALFVLFENNNFQKAEFLTHSKDWTGKIYSWRTNLKEYWILDEINDRLSLENAILRSRLPENMLVINQDQYRSASDTGAVQRYIYRDAHVENVTLNRESNYLMINRGSIGGLKRSMGVISNGSIVGIVSSVSDNFGVVMPILHSKFRASVRMKGSRDYGLLAWPGGSPEIADVREIPKHVPVEVGDTVITSGFSDYFPADMMVGYVESLDDQPEENFHRIKIRLSTDYRKLEYVQVIEDLYKPEQDSLLQEVQALDAINNPH
jgi:rod shape-determining protein MreC